MKTKMLSASVFVMLLLCTLVFTSCSKSYIESNEITNEMLDGKSLILPEGTEDDVAITFINNATVDQIAKMEENYRLTYFLAKEGKYGEVVKTLAEGDNLADVELSNFLNKRQLEDLSDYSANTDLTLRGLTCTTRTTQSPCRTKKRCCWNDGGTHYCWTVYSINIC